MLGPDFILENFWINKNTVIILRKIISDLENKKYYCFLSCDAM
jgi:hypothetical protein